MPDGPDIRNGEPIAVVGLACRFPDASDPAEFLELVLSRRRAFRRLPPARLTPAGDGPAGPGQAGEPGQPAAPAAVRAALIEGWRFDRAAYGVTLPAYQATDPAHWLALETAARALADGGVPGGQGLRRDRTGVVIGNTLTGEVSRATGLRPRWPYVRRVIASALAGEQVPAARSDAVLRQAEAGFLAPFPDISEHTLAGSLPSAIADRICGHFGFRGGGHAVDAAHSASLLAVASACSALAAGELDAVVAGGVDISLDPFELSGLARMGVLAADDMRVYDARPTGFWPGEGCGLVVLMRAADARAAGLPSYAQIAGWGVSSAGSPALSRPGSGSLLLALRRAYQRAGVDPEDVQLIEGDGTGTASGDLAELTSLAEIRGGAAPLAAIGSVKANIGHTKAAAGVAGLIKATLAVAAGVIPPATGCARPHPLIAGEDARLRVPVAPEPWPARTRLAAVTSVGPGGSSVHVVLRRDVGSGPRRRVPVPARYAAAAAGSRHRDRRQAASRRIAAGTAAGNPGPGRPAADQASPDQPGIPAPAEVPGTEPFVFSGPDRQALIAELTQVAKAAPGLSDAEFHDLACQLGSRNDAGPVRAGLAARSQDELAEVAERAVALLPGLRPGRLAADGGAYAAEGGRGRVTLLFPGEPAAMAHPGPGPGDDAGSDQPTQPAILAGSLASLRWLAALGVTAQAATGHGLGEIAGLVWAGSLSEPAAARLAEQRQAALARLAARRTGMACAGVDTPAAEALCAGTGLAVAAYNGPGCHVLAGPAEAVRELARQGEASGTSVEVLGSPHGLYSPALAGLAGPLRGVLAELPVSPPARRLISTITGGELTADDDIPELLASQLAAPVRFAGAVRIAAGDTDLLVETGPGQALSRLAAGCCDVPAVSMPGGWADADAAAQATAALFAAGAVGSLRPLLAGRAARPIDIWTERTFITNPCETARPGPEPGDRDGPGTDQAGADRAGTDPAGTDPAATGQGTARPEGTGPDATGPDAPGPGARGREAARPATGRAGAGSTPVPGGGPAGRCEPGVPAGPRPPGDTAASWEPPIAGPGPWLRCFVPELSRAPAPSPPAGKPPWRVRAAAGQPFAARAASVFRHDAGSDVVLALVAGPEDPASWETLLTAAREAVTAERLVVVTASDGLAGFCASLHADHPSMGITLLQVPDTEQALQAASQFAGAEPGQLAELTLDSAGSPREQAMTAIDPAGGGTYPLGPADVILVSGMNSQPELACAASLACRGAALAVLAQPGPDDEPALAGLLAELRAAGRRVWCESADATDPDAVTAAVSELEAALGPVTAVVHGTAPAGRQPAAELDHQALRAHLAGQLARLATVLDCFEPARLRLLLTFGSVAQRYGTPGGCGDSLASAAVAGYAARRASTLPRCQALDVAWPPWPPGPGEVPVTERARLLRQMLATPGLPGHAAVHGRVGVPAPPSIRRGAGGPDPSGRFLETILVNYPGTELVADTRLTPRADPYLADYLMDGLSVLPAAMALEGMAQAAAAVAGQPLLTAGPVAMDAPVLIPGGPEGAGTVIRVCAVRRGSTVETVLRCAETGFRVDHARAVFRPGQPRPASGKAGPAARGSGAASSPGGVVDGTDLYGPVCFQSGRFRRVAFLPEVTSRSCRALVRGGDDQPWFGVPGEPAAPALVLGSAGLNDAALQVLQACLPHRRLLMAGCESVTVSGDDLRGALQVQARRSEQDPGGSGTAAAWDVTVLDVTGQPVVAWHRLRLHDAGPLARTGSWHPALLAASLEGRATELGLHPSLRVAVISGRVPVPVAAGASQAAGHGNADPDQDPGPGPGPGGQAGPGPGGQAEPGSGGQAEPGPGGQAEPGPGNWTSTADGRWLLDGLDLSVRAAVPVACQWQAVGQPESPGDTGDEGLAQLREQLLARPAEPAATAHARFRTIGSCLADLGRPPGEPLTLADACDHGWLVVRAASATVACAVVEISGVPGPAVISIATASPRAQAPAARPATPR